MALTLAFILALLCGAHSASLRPNSSTPAKYTKTDGVLDNVLDGTLDSKTHSAANTLDLLASDKLRRSVMEDIKVLLDSQIKALLKNGIDRVSGLLRRKLKPKQIPRSSVSRNGKKTRKVESLETLETENRNSDFIKVLTDDSLQDPDDTILRDAVDELLKQNKDNVLKTKNSEDVSENMKDQNTAEYYHKDNKYEDTISEDEDVISQYFYDNKKNKRNMKKNHKKDLSHDTKYNLPKAKQENDSVVEKTIDLDKILKSAIRDFSALSQEDENINDDDNEKNTFFKTDLTSTLKETLNKQKGKKHGDSALQDDSINNLSINENENNNSGKQKIDTESDSKQTHSMSRSSKHGHHKGKKLTDPHSAPILESEKNNENDKKNIAVMNHPEKSLQNTEEDNTHTGKSKQKHNKRKRHHNEKPSKLFHKDDINDENDIEIGNIATDIVLNNTIKSYESVEARHKDQFNNNEDKNSILEKHKMFEPDTLLETDDIDHTKDKAHKEKEASDENNRVQESIENSSKKSKKYDVNNSASDDQSMRKEKEENISEENKDRSYERENSEVRTVHSFISKKKPHPANDKDNDISTEEENSEERTIQSLINKNQLRSVTGENNDKSTKKNSSEEDSFIKYLTDKNNQHEREKDTSTNEDDSINSGTEENNTKEIVKVRNAPEEKKSHACHNKKEGISTLESDESNLIRDLIQNKEFKKSFSFSLNFTS